ncbi:hypothetical protein RJT34_20689 [Clitoria ternatea]|uniref:DUF7750 domain-containing protein n=1 Tax=Clitoria ternatea TaxID=43366 RepID=A0AAN9P621_CLITE
MANSERNDTVAFITLTHRDCSLTARGRETPWIMTVDAKVGLARFEQLRIDTSVDSEHGQVVQTAQVVINMLDVTVPGTLTKERTTKVLTAVGQGEPLMKALQDAVPEDVHGKLTAVVTGILHARGSIFCIPRSA